MALAGCMPASPGPSAPPLSSEPAAVYAQVVAAIRAERPAGAPERIFLADVRFAPPRYAGSPHPEALLRELVARGVVEGVYEYERRSESYPCTDCTRIVFGPVVEHERALYVDPSYRFREVEPSRGIPVKHSVDVNLARVCTPESERNGSCTAESTGAGACRGREEHSRRYFFTREPNGALRVVGCTVTRVI
jgi:hypothetical protein